MKFDSKKRYGSKDAGRGCIPNRVDIEKRPAIVDSRKRVGDWEGDTIIGSHKGGAVIASMVERKSRLTVLSKSADKTTKSVMGGIIKEMETLSGLITRVMDKGLKKWPHCDQIHVQKNVNRSLQETNDDFRGTILLCR